MTEISELKITNARIIDFYQRNPQLNFETSNIIIIDLYEKMLDVTTGNMNNMISNQILSDIKQQTHELQLFKNELNKISTIQNMTSTNLNSEISMMKHMIDKMNDEITNKIITKLFDIKQLYTDDLKLILCNSQNDNIVKLVDTIEKHNDAIIGKTYNVINDLIPNLNNNITSHYENIINNFKSEINSNLEQLKLSNNNLSSEKINEIFENKYNNLMQNVQNLLINSVTNTEERLTTNINEIKNISLLNQNSQEKINNDFQEYISRYKISSFRGQYGENKLEAILNKLYSNSEIIKTATKTNSGDFILKREDKPSILFENKDYGSQVDKNEVIKFISDIENTECHGIFLSQSSSITGKKNYQIEYHKGKILIYLNFVEYSSDKIATAVDIIDDLAKKLSLVENNNILTDELLDYINNEYSTFASKKEKLMNYLKESNKKSIELLTELELPTLVNFLSSKFASTKLNNFVCDICNDFIGKNRSSLSAHKKKCNKLDIKLDNKSDNKSESTDSDESNKKSSKKLNNKPVICVDI